MLLQQLPRSALVRMVHNGQRDKQHILESQTARSMGDGHIEPTLPIVQLAKVEATEQALRQERTAKTKVAGTIGHIAIVARSVFVRIVYLASIVHGHGGGQSAIRLSARPADKPLQRIGANDDVALHDEQVGLLGHAEVLFATQNKKVVG